MPIDFVLDGLNTDLTMTALGALETGEGPDSLVDVHATVVVNTTADIIKSIFRFQTDSLDFDNEAPDDIKYYVIKNNWTENLINPANADLTDGAIFAGAPNDKKALKHDFVRHLAVRLFNTHFGVDLFTNEPALLTNLSDLGDGVNVSIRTLLNASDIANSATGSGSAGNYYRLNTDTGDSNFTRKLMLQILHSSGDKTRFSNIGSPDASGNYGIPVAANDSISFRLAVNPHADQGSSTTGASVTARNYRVKIVLT